MTKSNLLGLQDNNRAIIRQICYIKAEDVATVMSRELLAKLALEDLILILKKKRLCWNGRVECSSGAVRTACDKKADEMFKPRRPQDNIEKN